MIIDILILTRGKIGSVASKGCDLRKIPLKEFGPVKYHWKVHTWTESTILLDLSVRSVNLDQNTPKPLQEL